ncbi:MAG TPA: hypothetical protein VD794_16010 [Flavisolibacter sp.]|nr:hypothetical protein [Flavisolibacter sp.]
MPKETKIENPFMDLIALTESLWHERKGLDWASRPIERKRIIARLEKTIGQISTTLNKMPQEIEIIKKMYIKE